MEKLSFELTPKETYKYDVVVCGGGVSGVSAAISAARNGAKVALIEAFGALGGTLTNGLMLRLMDSANKGGIVAELLSFLTSKNMTCTRFGKRLDENGRLIPGEMMNPEGAKYFFDRGCMNAGVEVFLYSRVAAVKQEDGKISSALLVTECGIYAVEATIFIDATGNGDVAAMAGCEFEYGDATGATQAASVGGIIIGYPPEFDSIDSEEAKTAYHNMLESYNISTTMGQVALVKLPSLREWTVGLNMEFGVVPDNIKRLTDATIHGRKEFFETIEKHAQIPGYENIVISQTCSHIGIRDGRRIAGMYCLSDEDILKGSRFEDGICLVTMGVDVHKLHLHDSLDASRGLRSKPYHIPYRSLVARDIDNLLLAGRCISGEFYAHSSYRVMGNMMATGEAAGYAASLCIKENKLPKNVNGTAVSEFMKLRGYEL